MNFQITNKIDFENFAQKNWNAINIFLDGYQSSLPPLLYGSVDIRESSHKYAPVDMNMYPAGFNNICKFDQAQTTNQFATFFKQTKADAKTIGIFIESHTKNLFYLDHIYQLSLLITNAGYQTFLFTIDNDLFESGEQKTLNLISQSQHQVTIHLAQMINHQFFIQDQALDLIVMNNDQSKPFNINWDEIKTPIHPTPKIGWFKRKKADHFSFYEKVVSAFSAKFSVEPNLLMAQYTSVDQVNFATKDGIDKIADEFDLLQKKIGKESPIYIKANS